MGRFNITLTESKWTHISEEGFTHNTLFKCRGRVEKVLVYEFEIIRLAGHMQNLETNQMICKYVYSRQFSNTLNIGLL